MITLFIIFVLAVLAITIWGWNADIDNPLGGIAAIGGMLTLGGCLISPLLPVSEKYKKFEAVSSKVGDEIIVQSPGLPTQIVKEIKFIDKPLYIVEINMVNIFEGVIGSEYKVEIREEKNYEK